MCLLNYWDMGYCIVILSIFRDIFGFCPKINFRDMGYLHLICIKIGTVVLLTDLFPHFYKVGLIDPVKMKERHLARSCNIWDMCLLNYWDMGYCIVILSIFRDIFGFCPKINFRDMGYLPILF
jgi:hypothetical protein